MASAAKAMCGQPLPPAVNSVLLSLGTPQATINRQVCDLVNSVQPSAINTNYPALLAKPRP